MMKRIVIAIVMVVIIAGALVLRNFLPGRSDSTDDSQLKALLEKDMEGTYPKTPYEVINLYCRMTKEMHGSALLSLKGTNREEKTAQLVDQIRYTYTANLLETNLRDSQIKAAEDNIKVLNENKTYMMRYELSEKSEKAPLNTDSIPEGVLYEDKRYGSEMYKYVVKYSMKVARDVEFTYQQLLLLEEDGKWKLLGFSDMNSNEYEIWNESSNDE